MLCAFLWLFLSGLLDAFNIAGPPQHFIDFADVKTFKINVLAGEFLQHDVLALNKLEQLLV